MTRKASCNCGKLSLMYEGPDPERISLCQCNECQRRTGSVLQRASATSGRARDDRRPIDDVDVSRRQREAGHVSLLRQLGGHVSLLPGVRFDPVLGDRRAPDLLGVAVGGFTDPTFPPPIISGFEAYGRPWVMNISDL